MNEITAAIIGAIASALLMLLANVSNRRERDIRELIHRINQLEKEVAKQQNPRSRLRGLWSSGPTSLTQTQELIRLLVLVGP